MSEPFTETVYASLMEAVRIADHDLWLYQPEGWDCPDVVVEEMRAVLGKALSDAIHNR